MSASRFVLPVAELSAALALVKPCVATRNVVPLYKQLLFTGDTVRAYTGSVGAVAYVTWKVSTPVTVDAERFIRLVTSLREQAVEKLTLEVSSAPLAVTVSGGGMRARFLSKEPAEFPLLTPPKLKARVRLTPEFWDAVRSVESVVSQDETRPELRGVYWDAQRVTAGSRARLARCTVLTKGLPKALDGIVLPAVLLSRFLAQRASQVEVGRDEASGLLWFFLETAALAGPLIAAEFPVAGIDGVFTATREKFIAAKQAATWCQLATAPALQRFEWFVDPQRPRLTVVLDPERQVLRCVATFKHTIEEEYPATIAGDLASVCVHLAHFREALAQCTRFGVLPGAHLMFVNPQRGYEQVVVPFGDSEA